MGKLDEIFLKSWEKSDHFSRKSFENASKIFGTLAKSTEKVAEHFEGLAQFFWDCQEAAEEILEKNYEPQ